MCEQKICQGCKKLLQLSDYKLLSNNVTSSRCINCLERKKTLYSYSSNVIWTLHPSLKEYSNDYNIHPKLTKASPQPINITCSCNHKIIISVQDLFYNPFCPNCENCFISDINIDILYRNTLKLISDSVNFHTFNESIKLYNPPERWKIQEILAKIYFETHKNHYNIKEYKSKLLNEDTNPDWGTDGIIYHNDGKISYVQVKYRSSIESALSRNCISGMSLEALANNEKFYRLFLFSNSVKIPINITNCERNIVKTIMYNNLCDCDWDSMKYVSRKLYDSISSSNVFTSIPNRLKLRKWQQEAYNFVLYNNIVKNDGKINTNFGKKSVIAPPGSGKTKFAIKVLNIKSKHGFIYNNTLIVVPNLSLLSQWFENLASIEHDRNYLLVGSDVGEECKELDIPFALTTDPLVIKNFIENNDNTVIVSTYQSLNMVLEGSEYIFDLTIVDEAHLTSTGNKNGCFHLPARLDFPSSNTLFVTATPRIFKSNDLEVSMFDKNMYGDMYTYNINNAISDKIINNYSILTGIINTDENSSYTNSDEIRAHILYKSLIKHDILNCLVCSNTHAASKRLYDECNKLINTHKLDYKTILLPPAATSSHKSKAIYQFNTLEKCIVFNVNVFTLGTDIPCLYSIFLNGDRKSVISIIQTVCRPLRIFDSKLMSYIILPVILNNGIIDDSIDELSMSRRVITSMCSVDNVLNETVINKRLGRSVGSNSRNLIVDMFDNSNTINLPSINAIDVQLFDRYCDHPSLSPYLRLELLIEWCGENDKLPLYKEEYKDCKIGGFLSSLLVGKHCKNDREDMLNRLRAVSDNIKKEVDNRLNKRTKTELQIL